MLKKDGKNPIEQAKEAEEQLYLEIMKLYDDLINMAVENKLNVVSALKKSKEGVRNKYIENVYGSALNPAKPEFNKTFLEAMLPKLKKQIEEQKNQIKQNQAEDELKVEKEKQESKYIREKIHPRADEEFSSLIRWLQEIYDTHLLVLNKIDFEIFTKRKMQKLVNDILYKYSNFHTNSIIKQYIYEMENFEISNKQKGYNNFHIKYLETVIKDWFWLYDSIFWVIKKEFEGTKIFGNPDEHIIFSKEELALESNKGYTDLFHNKTQLEAFKIIASLIKEVYIGLGIERIADQFNIELRPL